MNQSMLLACSSVRIISSLRLCSTRNDPVSARAVNLVWRPVLHPLSVADRAIGIRRMRGFSSPKLQSLLFFRRTRLPEHLFLLLVEIGFTHGRTLPPPKPDRQLTSSLRAGVDRNLLSWQERKVRYLKSFEFKKHLELRMVPGLCQTESDILNRVSFIAKLHCNLLACQPLRSELLDTLSDEPIKIDHVSCVHNFPRQLRSQTHIFTALKNAR